ncbi:SGNH/GDSL hydrolase family protein [Tundrisphaera lichenicola]|uniref:SGNH/GDSL hydrolase family protein n=1 Tax=Tundrisphaera lichenicola TaxID=2029860 RepID=UPI003EB8E56C
MIRSIVPLGVAILLGLAPPSKAGPPFELVDGDRVVLIGGTLIERDQSHGYLETRLTRRYPDRSITFRNLGWSGDTVEGPSRARFGTTTDGFQHLRDHVLALKPTVIILGYGANESFEGKAGLPKFLQDLDHLLATIEPSKARLVFLAPNRQEDLGPPLPDPTRHNADLALYRDALKAVAEERGAAFVDLFELLPDGAKATPPRPLTTNGIHLTPYGYWRMAAAVEEALFPGPKPPAPDEPAEHPLWFSPVGAELGQIPGGYRLRDHRFATLPPPPPPDGGPDLPRGGYLFRLGDTEQGRYSLKVDGRAVATGDREAWASGIVVRQGPEFDQVEALRSAINAKNELYFYRWRPQNETYLFGFRKHEQGQNAREIPEFDPLVAAREAEIARLRVPVPHLYELTREGEVGR